MTSRGGETGAYVWIWLPGRVEPVVAGKLERDGVLVRFNYGRSYLDMADRDEGAIPLYEPELPLRRGALPLPRGLNMPGCIRDAAPDAWGRRVILNRLLGARGAGADTGDLDELTYLLESGSDRVGALDFQRSPTEYVPRGGQSATLEELLESARRVERGVPLSPALDQALFHGSSIGGARPKALIEDGAEKFVAKFSSSTDVYNVVKAEFVAMRLAALAGIDAAEVRLERAAGRDVLLVRRFDRERAEGGWLRKSMVSALTLLGLDETVARYASYERLAEVVRHRFASPCETLRELFTRLVFNVLCGNTDDHARNHAAFWDGQAPVLTPAYDVCPQGRTGNEASQGMRIKGEDNLSRLSTCLAAAPDYLLPPDEARRIMEATEAAIRDNWDAVCDQAGLSPVDRAALWGRQFLNPFSVDI
ncbi:type II toxin-antitoxin system HipA family toxin [Pseudodesulfovibrio indicus]|uniref:Phosphatidylinositol kinase n=1 Tax=Pseudodesulfovibrio indicus TaxID=1716143 RepID=A0A126QKM2_9BACT|nr:HipA domain-containing protein [Pseudodesulfovibrio indicus]AMK10593.1 phosphatidylinositol kinase [Pseudodesulfovibrio indicus]TDT82737.1 serine/threonine-protein kinase HipA [Pseudodesulfovibrio indicus]